MELPTRHTFRIPSCKPLAKFTHVKCWQLSYHWILSSSVQYIYIMKWGFIIQVASCNFNICDLYPNQNRCMFNTVVFWSLVWGYHCLGGTCCLHLSSTLNMEAIYFSEMLVSVTLHGIPFQKNVVLTYSATRTWSQLYFFTLTVLRHIFRIYGFNMEEN